MTTSLPPAQRALLERFADYERAVHGLASATVRNHRIYLQAYLRWGGAARSWTDVPPASPADLADFLIAEAARGVGGRTRRAEVAALRRFHAWLVLSGRAPHNPAVALSARGSGRP